MDQKGLSNLRQGTSSIDKASRCISDRARVRNDEVALGERGCLDRCRRRVTDELAALALTPRTVSLPEMAANERRDFASLVKDELVAIGPFRSLLSEAGCSQPVRFAETGLDAI